MKTLSETNPYFQDKANARKLNARSTRTSCGVEGIVQHDVPPLEINRSKSKAAYNKIKQRLNSF